MILVKDAVAISESGLLINSMTNEAYVLNPMGIKIFYLLKRRVSEPEILERIVSEFDIQKKDAENDLKAFIHNLLEFNLASS